MKRKMLPHYHLLAIFMYCMEDDSLVNTILEAKHFKGPIFPPPLKAMEEAISNASNCFASRSSSLSVETAYIPFFSDLISITLDKNH